jgi:2'-5' RNA ligase
MLRVFFALQPTSRQNSALVEAVAPLVATLHGQRVPAENLHATLCFIGAVADEKLEVLKGAAQEVRGRALTMRFDQLDYWVKPRVLCATATETVDPAQALSAQLADASVAAGFAPDAKPFRAHLTLARKVEPARAAECEWPRPLAPPITMHCDRFVLMRSERGESGSIYSVVSEWPLDGDKSR